MLIVQDISITKTYSFRPKVNNANEIKYVLKYLTYSVKKKYLTYLTFNEIFSSPRSKINYLILTLYIIHIIHSHDIFLLIYTCKILVNEILFYFS
jgi:hypothetical protein